MLKSPSRRLRAIAAGALALVVGVTCTDGGLTGPSSLRSALALVPSFSRAAIEIYRNLAAFDFAPDNVHLRLIRANETVAVDTVVALTPGQDSLVLALSVELQRSPETFLAKIQVRDGTQVLFEGTQTITAHAGTTTPTPPPIELEYAGPGADVVTLDVNPDTTIFVADSVTMRTVGRNAAEQVVNDLAIDWSIADATMGTISTSGVFKPAKRGAAVITATLPHGVSGSATVNVVAPPASLAPVSGGDQSGLVGSVLPQPIVVEVRAADNLPSAGVTVNFAITAGGGSVNPTSAVTGTNGRASTVLTLGPTAGTNTVRVSAGELTPISVSASATTPQPATRRWIGPAQGAWEAAANWSGNRIPLPLDTVLLDGPADYVISIGSAVTVAKLTIGTATGQQGLIVSAPAGTLTVTDSIRVATSGLLLLGASTTETVLTSGPIVVDGIVELLNGNIAGSGNIDVSTNGSLLISGDAAMGLTNRVVRNAGLTFLAADVGTLNLHNGSRIENLAGGEFMTQGEIDIVQGTGAAGLVRNDGLYQMITAGVGTHRVGVAFENNGTIEMFNGIMAFAGPSMLNSASGTIRGTGTIDVSATALQQSGTIEPGLSPGLLSFTGALPLQAASRVNIELGATSPENGHDVLAVSGAVTFAGTLQVSLINGYTPVAGDSLTVVRYASRTGTFDTLIGLSLGGGMFLDPVYTATGLSLVARQTAPAGVSWINPAGGNWSVGSNWSTGVVPSATDNVAINLAGTYTVTLDLSTTVAGLTLGGAGSSPTLAASARTLTVNGAITIAPSATVDGNALLFRGATTVTNAGQMLLRGNTTFEATTALTNSGTIEVSSTGLWSGAVSTTSTSLIRIVGQPTGGTAALSVANGFTNNGNILLTSTGGHASTLTVNGTLTNSPSGRIQTTTTGTRTLSAELNNQGVLEVDAPLTMNRASATHVNSGTIDLTTADLTLTQSGTTPSFTNTATGFIGLGANRDLTVTGGTLDIDEGSVSGPLTARLIVTNAALAFTTANVGTLPLTLTATTIVGGAVTVPNGQTLTLLNGALADPVTVQSGGILMTHGAVALNGAVSLPTGSTLRLMGQPIGGTSALSIANAVTNHGIIELTSTGGHAASLTMPTATLTNASDGAIWSRTTGSRTLAAQLDNQGVVEVDNALTLSRTEADHLNSGTVDLTTADLIVTQSGSSPTFTSTGSVVLGANRDWTVTGGALDVSQGTVSGPLSARLIVTNATLSFTTANIGLLPLTLTTTAIAGGSVTIPAGQTLTLLNGALADPVTVESGGVLLAHGAVSLTGGLNLPAGSTVRLMGQPIGGTSALTISTGVVNNGTIDLTSTGGHAASLTMPAGVRLVNSSGALVRTLATGTRTIAAEVDNQGTLEVDNALTINAPGADHLNTGTIDLTTADLTVTQTGTTPSFTSVGSVTLGANRDWTVNGGTLDIDQGAVTGPTSARLLVNNAVLSVTTANVGLLPLTLTNTTLAGGTLSIPSGETLTLLNGGLADPVTVQGGGTLLVHGAVTLSGALSLPTGSTLRLMGQPIGGTAALTVGTNVVNNGTIELTSTGGHAATLSMPTTTLTNSTGATIRSLTTGTRTLAVALDNQGTLEVDNALTINRANAAHQNVGTIDLTTADLTVTQSGTSPTFFNLGTITLGANRDWTVNGGTLDIDQGILTGPTSARLIVNNATLSVTPASVGTLPLTLTNTVIPGGITIPSGQSLTLLNGGLSDPVSVQGGGTLMTHGAVALSGGLSLPLGSTLRVMGQPIGGTANLTVSTNVTNNGIVELTSTGGHAATLTMPTTTLTNAPSGLIQTLATGTRTLAAQLDNQGTVDVDNALTINRANAVHTNSGVINLVDADLIVTQSGTPSSFTNFSTGSVTLGLNRDWTVNGGTLDIDEGAVTGLTSSRLIVNNAAMQFTTGAVTLPLTLTNTSIIGGAVTVPTGQTLTLLNGALNDPITVDAGGTLLTHGSVALTGAVANAGTIDIHGQPTGGTAALTVANGFTNAGLIDLSSAGGHGATLTVSAGSLINATGATLRSSNTGTRTLNAELNNQGTFQIDNQINLNRASAQHVNSGIINLVTGNLDIPQTGTAPSFTNTGTITISGSRTLGVTGGTLTNSGSGAAIQGVGSLSLLGTSLVNNGRLRPAGSGAAGTLTITGGSWSQTDPNGALDIEIGGTSAGTFDRMITSAATLGGVLNVSIINGFNVPPATQFTIISGPISQTFGSVVAPLGWTVTYNPTSVVLTAP